MRTEHEVLQNVLDVADRDETVRAVIRTNLLPKRKYEYYNFINVAVRDLLNKMIHWHLFLREGHPVDMGILDSHMEKLLEEDLFQLYRQTYPTAEYEKIWEAFDAAAKLWHILGNDVAARCNYPYPTDTENHMLSLIKSL